LGSEGGRPGTRHTPAVGHTCPGNLGIVKILRYIRSDIAKKNWQEDGTPPPLLLANGALCLSTPKHNGKFGTACLSLRYDKEEKTRS